MVTSRDEQDRGGTGRHAAGQARQVSRTRPRKGGTSLDLQVGMRGCQEEATREEGTEHRVLPRGSATPAPGRSGRGLGWGLLCPKRILEALKAQ